MTQKTIDILSKAKRIVIKIGSVLITNKDRDQVNQNWINALSGDIQKLLEENKEFIIVSSGGVALGRSHIGVDLNTKPEDIPLEQKQAASAVGQFYVFQAYHQAFKEHGREAAQVLLTLSETENRRTHLNARETMNTLLSRGIIPVINENDVVSTEEIRFGDNDRLAARVAQMMDADAIILMSTIDGLYSENPQTNPQADHIPFIEGITQEHINMAGEAIPGLSSGGMKSKIEAAQAANRCGIPLIVMNGRLEYSLNTLIEDHSVKNTIFYAQKTKNNARKRFIGAHMSPKGSVFVDQGAQNALKNGKSLLPVGVKSVEGAFERGDAVHICCEDGEKLGIGLIAYSSSETDMMLKQSKDYVHKLQGYIGRDELIHRNDMVLD